MATSSLPLPNLDDRPHGGWTVAARWARQHWFLLLVCVAWALPPLLTLARRAWTSDSGAQGPLILSTGLWILAREARGQGKRATRGAILPVMVGLGLAIPAYLLGGVVGAVSLQMGATWLGMVTLLYALVGAEVTRRLWFPLLYLAFLIPPPSPIIGWATGALRLWVSQTAVDLLAAGGLEVAQSGNSLFIDGYELLVEAACSGLNSLASLLAVGLFYAYLRGRTWTRTLLIGVLIVPVAIVANLVRVVLLMLLVHYRGAAVLETALHEAAGFLMFFVALAGLYLLDTLLSPLLRWKRRA